MSLGLALSAGAQILGAIGKGKDKPASQQSGYSAAPANVKKILEGPYWDYATQTFNDLINAPKARVAPYDRSQLFGNPEASAIQQAADMRAGLIPQQEMIYQNGQYLPLNVPAPTGQTYAPQGASPMPNASMQQQGVANKSSGTYYNPQQALGLSGQGISTQSLAAYLAQLGVR